VPNFASFLRVTCMRYLRRAAATAERRAEDSGDAEPGPPRLAVVSATR
jgi:predicted DNA-binding ribbon-helix-helix protein